MGVFQMITYTTPDVKAQPDELKRFIEANKYKLEAPGSLTGKELNTTHKDWEEIKTRILMCMPVEYSAGINNLGVAIMYELFNEYEDMLCERAYMPEPRLYKLLQTNNLPVMFSLESKHEAKDFDMIGFSLYFELQFNNLVSMLHYSGIPIYSQERGFEYPLVVMGGVASYSPSPVEEFVDAILIGDGEAQTDDLVAMLREYRTGKYKTKDAFLLDLTNKVKGCYVPRFYEMVYE
jgi:radical SAM superfamily enzyme YgiQ (UPF0313 family)